jgi:hypothetical protein
VEQETNPERYSQLAAIRYYLHYTLWQIGIAWRDTHKGVTNYKTLLDDLENWRLRSNEKICLVTFNYDTLLEEALPGVHVAISDIEDYIKHENYKIIKVHGSVNWGHRVTSSVGNLDNRSGSEIVNGYIESAAELTFGDSYQLVDTYPIATAFQSSTWSNSSRRVPLFPAIALPVTRKSTFECPTAHLNVLNECLPQVTRIITIGWRGNEEHFMKLVREKLARRVRVLVVAGNQSEAQLISDEIREKGMGEYFWLANGGFTETILNDEINKFLLSQP